MKLSQQRLNKSTRLLTTKHLWFSFCPQELIPLLHWLSSHNKKWSISQWSVWVRVKVKRLKRLLQDRGLMVVGFCWPTVIWPNRGCQVYKKLCLIFRKSTKKMRISDWFWLQCLLITSQFQFCKMAVNWLWSLHEGLRQTWRSHSLTWMMVFSRNAMSRTETGTNWFSHWVSSTQLFKREENSGHWDSTFDTNSTTLTWALQLRH